jgi:sporulation protein YlmC with PRC-barrel domain
MKLLVAVVALGLMTSVATAQNRPAANSDNAPPGTAPADQFTVTNYYKQDVYDHADNKVGTIDDVLIDKQGKVAALIIGVGGFLGIGEKDVAEPFSKVQMTKKNDKWYLTMDANKEELKSAPGLKYDRNTTAWSARPPALSPARSTPRG